MTFWQEFYSIKLLLIGTKWLFQLLPAFEYPSDAPKMDFSDDRKAEMYRTETPQRGTTKSLFGIIQERVYGRGQRNPYYQRREEAIAFDHQRTPLCRWVRAEMDTAYQP